MFNAFKTLAEANARHAASSPIAHTAVASAYALGAGLLITTVARKMGEQDLKKMQTTYANKWN